ncbi:hypothetical protein GF336_03145 [Candidatus Woesearchaeota archaeon]|nr:hypothetical protein [Candidatus Woesearchaeota archaeon]
MEENNQENNEKKPEDNLQEKDVQEKPENNETQKENKEQAEEEPTIENKESEAPKKMKLKKTTMWKTVSAALLILLVASIYTGGFSSMGSEDSKTVQATGDSIILLNDKRCSTCDTSGLKAQLETVFPEAEFTEIDYNEEQGKEIYEENELSTLPAVLFTGSVKDREGYSNIEQYLEEKGDYLSLKIGATFDPEAEICNNEIDDDGNGDIDCEDESCKSQWQCMEKKEKPEVEVFVMSHCPYGTQIEKGIIPVMETLGGKADIQIKFCDYAMHGEKELDEQLQQYCIQEEQEDKFLDYLKCFLEEGKSEECIEDAEIDKTKLNTCIGIIDAKYKVSDNFEDKSTYKGQFPTFNVFKEEVDDYGIRGSPALVINGVTASAGRDPASLLDAVCTGFKNPPEECEEELSSETPSPGFGFETTDASASGGCGA